MTETSNHPATKSGAKSEAARSGTGPGPASAPTMAGAWKSDLVSGFLVFLIALPLCLGIAKASGFPPVAGIVTAVVGGLVTGLFSNSELTIKGPAAGMIAIVLGAMNDFGYTQGTDAAADLQAYKLVLAVGVAAGAIQILFGLFRAGILGEFFPMAPVHGLLASIGLIIISKQIHPMFGVASPKAGPIGSYLAIPATLASAELGIAAIGVTSLAILVYYPMLKKALPVLAPIPAQLVVVVTAIIMGQVLRIDGGQLITLPAQLQDAIVMPDFSQVFGSTALKWIAMFALVGTLESMLSAKAIDLLDPWKRKTNLNRDVLGVGVANTAVAAIGGLPMISEILRSSANISYGGRTRLANLFHGVFLVLALLLLAGVVKLIPLAALGAMLVFAGFRLASPKQFLHMWRAGKGQFLVFCLTIAFILPEGHLLDGIGVGILAELVLNFLGGASFGTLFKPDVQVASHAGGARLSVARSLTFTNWVAFRKLVDRLGPIDGATIDLSHAKYVDRTAHDKLLELRREFDDAGRTLRLEGLPTATAH